MSSRRRAGNTGNSSPVVTRKYDFRDRTRGKGDPSVSVRPNIKDTEKKDRAVEQNVKNKASRRNAKQVQRDTDDDSDDGSDYSNSSRSELSENDRTSHSLHTSSTSRSSTRSQPFSPRLLSKYTDDDTNDPFRRPPLRHSKGDEKGKQSLEYKPGSSIRQPSSAGHLTNNTNDDKDKINYYEEETWRDRTKTLQFQPSSEEYENVQQPRKAKDQLKETTVYKEVGRTLRSTNRGVDPFLRYRSPQIPTENTTSQAAQSRIRVHFSDDDEGEERVHHQQQNRAFYPRPVEGDKINHYPSVEQKASIVKKPSTSRNRTISIVGTCMKYLVLAFLVLLVGSMTALYISPMSLLKMTGQVKFVDDLQIKKNLKEDFENLTSIFPTQSPLMWKRSRRILELHLKNWKGNAEPAIILLTGARDAEQTLLCLGTRLADIYSSSLSGSSIVISGSDWASGSNEEVKEYIDNRLTAGFQATTQAAVLHRLELLPAGSLLILYKYCDHESAVFKDVTLLLTVLLDEETLEKDIPLTDLEEKVRAFLIEKLIDSKAGSSHDGMDKDKFSGVWSRISHVVLPVFPEKNISEECVKKKN